MGHRSCVLKGEKLMDMSEMSKFGENIEKNYKAVEYVKKVANSSVELLDETNSQYMGCIGKIPVYEVAKIGLLLSEHYEEFTLAGGLIVARNENHYKSGVAERLWIVGQGDECFSPGDKVIGDYFDYNAPEAYTNVVDYIVKGLRVAGYQYNPKIEAFEMMYSDI